MKKKMERKGWLRSLIAGCMILFILFTCLPADWNLSAGTVYAAGTDGTLAAPDGDADPSGGSMQKGESNRVGADKAADLWRSGKQDFDMILVCQDGPKKKGKDMIYDYTITTGKGEELNLADYKGKVILVVNTATGCGFTPQYAPIEQMYRDYHDQGLEILDIPCNQFGKQAPGTDEEIHEFCTMHFNTTFPQMKKADVNGENELPLYTYLKAQKGFEGFGEHPYKALLEKMFAEADPEWDKKPDIKWNFTKFVIDREGNVVARFEPTAEMSEVEACVKALL